MSSIFLGLLQASIRCLSLYKQEDIEDFFIVRLLTLYISNLASHPLLLFFWEQAPGDLLLSPQNLWLCTSGSWPTGARGVSTVGERIFLEAIATPAQYQGLDCTRHGCEPYTCSPLDVDCAQLPGGGLGNRSCALCPPLSPDLRGPGGGRTRWS